MLRIAGVEVSGHAGIGHWGQACGAWLMCMLKVHCFVCCVLADAMAGRGVAEGLRGTEPRRSVLARCVHCRFLGESEGQGII